MAAQDVLIRQLQGRYQTIEDSLGAAMPVGSIVEYGGSSAPTGWLICDGSAISRTDYSDLFGAIGTFFGTGDGSTTFNIPDFRGRAPYGKGTHTDNDTLGESDGVAEASRTPKTTLSTSQIPSHTHGIGLSNTPGVTNATDQGARGQPANSLTQTSGATGGGGSHNHGFLVVNFIIKALPSGDGSLGASGSAGGVLSGTYPNPSFAVDMATQGELDAVAAAKANATHSHAQADITNLTTDLAAKQPLDSDLTTIAAISPGAGHVLAADGAGWISKSYAALKTALGLVKGDVGLGNVDNTSDASKPVSTAQQTALDGKADIGVLESPDGTSLVATATDESAPAAADGYLGIWANGAKYFQIGPNDLYAEGGVRTTGMFGSPYATLLDPFSSQTHDFATSFDKVLMVVSSGSQVYTLPAPPDASYPPLLTLTNSGTSNYTVGIEPDTGNGVAMMGNTDTLAVGESRHYVWESSGSQWVPIRQNGVLRANEKTEITASGSYTVPDGCTALMVEAIGGGGGGGGASGTTSQAAAGGGGGAGSYGRAIMFVVPGDTVTITIGAAGTAGAATAGTGGTGGTTTVVYNAQTVISASGGTGGVGMATGTAPEIVLGGTGGEATSSFATGTRGSGEHGSPGIRLSGTVAGSGSGASSLFGRSGKGRNTDGVGATADSDGYGGGGGGAVALTSSNRAGGAGTPGIVCITPIT